MALKLEIQRACYHAKIPSDAKFHGWSESAIAGRTDKTELNIRIVEEHEMAALNSQYRGENKATNVLSFPFDAVTPEPMPILGDIVICAPIAFKEAEEQDRSVESYWAHLVVHGILHLLGYAHEKDTDAKIMESLESEILVNMNYPTPYEN